MAADPDPPPADTRALTEALFGELVAAQTRALDMAQGSPFPPLLWPGDGSTLNASAEAYALIHRYAAVLHTTAVDATRRLTVREMDDLAARPARAFVELRDGVGGADAFAAAMDRHVSEVIAAATRPHVFYFGAHLLRTAAPIAIELGPVRFEPRIAWAQAQSAAGNISAVTNRRLQSAWADGRSGARSRGRDARNERELRDMVGSGEWVCTVRTGELSSKTGEARAVFVARLGIAALSLCWRWPSEALADMGLTLDGSGYLAQYATGNAFGFGYSWTAKGPHGHFADRDWQSTWRQLEPRLALLGRAFALHADPALDDPRRPLLNGLLIALLWFHEGCREQLDLIAIAKFASAMDTLAAGRRAEGILSLIEHRLALGPDEGWFTDGTTPRAAVAEVYETVRNQMLHGSMRRLDGDWTRTRQLAERIAREFLLVALDWALANPELTSLRRLSRPD